MSGVAVLGLLWAAGGIWCGSRWWRDRVPASGATPTLPPGRARFGQPIVDGGHGRRQAMRLAYAAGATAVAGGLLLEWAWVLALGSALVNLGTLYRHLVFLLDDGPEERVVAHGGAARGAQLPLRTLLAGNLAD